ncbi:hypothetical protein T03_12533 [Trichinella britovi]|uniref:Uncharacterized protein n=1 Tax=Trichinella britovi TaxID=45882 RepID=A0A0V1BAV7_TRIBR|nr:hypothetical protein T03_12533 [Trichinella britovi]
MIRYFTQKMLNSNFIMNQFKRKRSYPSLLDSVSCATSYGAPSMRIAIIYLPHRRLSLTLCANIPDGCLSSQTYHERSKAEFLWPEATLAGNIDAPAKMLMPSSFVPFFLPHNYSYNQFLSQAGRPTEAQLGKSGETTLHQSVGKVAWKSRDQGYFDIANKLRRIIFDAKFFRFGMEYLNIRLYVGRSFLTVKQYTTGSSLRLRNT